MIFILKLYHNVDIFEFGVWLNNNFFTKTLVKGGNHLTLWIIPKSVMLRTFLSRIRFIYLQNDDKVCMYYTPNLSLKNQWLGWL